MVIEIRFVFARGMTGMTDESATARPLVPSTARSGPTTVPAGAGVAHPAGAAVVVVAAHRRAGGGGQVVVAPAPPGVRR